MIRVLPAMSRFLSVVLSLFALPAFAQQPPTAAAIMARVAANQDLSQSERAHFLYVQHAKVTARKGKTVRCEEITDSRVVPSGTGSRQQLLKLDGRLLVKGKYVTYNHLPAGKDTAQPAESDDITITVGADESDRNLVEGMRNNLTNTNTRDGIGANLFPLTSKSQAEYNFTLVGPNGGQEHLNGRDVFHITFTLKDKSDYGWKGDAWIDTSAYQPVVVRTAMSRKLPFAVRTLLGTSLPGLGFTVIYAPQNPAHTGPANDVWFPISFGTEFKLKLLFFYSREILIDAQNRDFELTHVTSKIVPADSPAPPQP